MSFGERLKTIRAEKGLSQRALAAVVGMSQQAIATYELDTREPGWSAVLKLASALGVDPNAFVDPTAAPTTGRPSAPGPAVISKRK